MEFLIKMIHLKKCWIKIYRLYNVNWSNTTGEIKNGNYVGLEAKGLEDIYVHCYDDIYKKQYDLIDKWMGL